jgi:N,N'-diacetylbacillosaminyl-diphospho-undecaprenol alpha-1,3-N-acetylgalactosaminyltransferase
MVIHLIHHPVSAKRFVEPIVKLLNSHGVEAELWIENREEFKDFISAIDCPKSFAKFDLSLNPFSVLVRLVRLLKRFVRLRPTAIQAHQTRAAFIPLFAALLARVPIRIYHNSGTPYLGYRGPLRALLWLLEFLNCRFATHVCTVSHSIRKKMIRHRIVRESKCEVLGEGSACGIDLAEFSMEQFGEQNMVKTRQALGIALDAYVVLYVGRPFRRKGFHTLLRAWQYMGASDNENVLLIAGCNDKDVVNTIGLPMKNVVALGYINDLCSCYATCDVVVLPSWHEGLPYSLLEGAAAAKPLVGSDIPGIDSIIINNKNGLLVPAGDSEALAEALAALKGNHDLRKRMGCCGRQYVEQYFDRKIFNKSLLDYYDRIGIKSYNASYVAPSVKN